MKKLLLSVLCLSAAAAWAGEVTYNFTDFSSLTPQVELKEADTNGSMSFDFDGSTTLTAGPVSFTPAPNAPDTVKVTLPRLWQKATGGQNFRFYKNNKLGFSTSEQTLTQIVFNCGGSVSAASLSASAGVITTSGKTFTWTGDAASVEIFYSTGSTVNVDSVMVTYGEKKDTPEPDPEPQPGTDGPEVVPTPDGTVIEMSRLTELLNPEQNSYNFSEEQNSFELDGYTFTLANGANKTWPAYNKGAGDLRIYADNTLTISSDKPMRTIAFVISANGLKRYADVTAQPEGIAKQNTQPLVWNGEADSVTFSTTGKNVYGSDGQGSKAAQFDFTKVIISEQQSSIVSEFAGEAGAPAYYNLQGQRVDNPRNGVFVRVQGGKATKVAK